MTQTGRNRIGLYPGTFDPYPGASGYYDQSQPDL